MFFIEAMQAAEEVAKAAEIPCPPVIVPPAHIDIPLWAVPIIALIFSAVVGYIWHRLEDRIKEIERIARVIVEEDKIGKAEQQIKINTSRLDIIERDAKDALKAEISKGGFITLREHAEFCATVCGNISKTLGEKFTQFEENLNLKLDNLRLAMSKSNKRTFTKIQNKRGKSK